MAGEMPWGDSGGGGGAGVEETGDAAQRGCSGTGAGLAATGTVGAGGDGD